MKTRSQTKQVNEQMTFIEELAPELISMICSYLSLKEFHRFLSSCTTYQKKELYNGICYDLIQDEFDFLIETEDCPNTDEILANIVKKGGFVKFDVFREFEFSEANSLYQNLGDIMIRKSYFKLCKALVERMKLRVESLNMLLYCSIHEEHLEFCKLLVSLSADVNHTTVSMSLLMHACYVSTIHIVKYLVASGADFNAIDDDGENALFYCIQPRNFDMMIFEYLIDLGVNYAIINQGLQTCLHYSSLAYKFVPYLHLLNLGVDSSLRDDTGATALDIIFEIMVARYNAATEDKIALVLSPFVQMSSDERLEHEREIIDALIIATALDS